MEREKNWYFSKQHGENTRNDYSAFVDFTPFPFRFSLQRLRLLCCHLNLIWPASFFFKSNSFAGKQKSLRFYWILHKLDHTNHKLTKYHIMQKFHRRMQWRMRSSLGKAGKAVIILPVTTIEIIYVALDIKIFQ